MLHAWLMVMISVESQHQVALGVFGARIPINDVLGAEGDEVVLSVGSQDHFDICRV